jgi:internalin A
MTQQAKQLIAQAKAEGWKRLDLGNCGLTDLETQVPELFELTDLEELVLSNEHFKWNKATGKLYRISENKGQNNRLSQLPQAMAKLKQLKILMCGGDSYSPHYDFQWTISDYSVIQHLTDLWYLDLSWNGITRIENLDKLRDLQELDLSCNGITCIENLDNSPYLHYLDLSWNRITRIENLDKLTNLQYLDLSRNQITRIENLDNSTDLQYLYLSENKITRLENLDKLPDLQKLDLSRNQITRIENLDNSTDLQHLYLSENKITRIENLDELSNLQELNLNHNQITRLENLDKLPDLQKLDLSKNQITRLENLGKLPNLQELNLSENQITQIAKSVDLPNLQQLNLHNNQITRIENLGKLPNLQGLNLSKNQIMRIENLAKLPNLQWLYLNENQITHIENLAKLRNLRLLDLNHNQITRIENLAKLPNLQKLYLSKNQITHLENLAKLPNLQELNLSENQITRIENLAKLPNLQELKLSDNKITRLENLDKLPNLQKLDLSSNKRISGIEDLDKGTGRKLLFSFISKNQITRIENLDKLPNLQELDLRHNEITRIENLDKLPDLQKLDLRGNQITRLENLDKLPNLQHLNLSDNQITSYIDLAFLLQFPKLYVLTLRGNPLGNIPTEVLADEPERYLLIGHDDCLPYLSRYLLDLKEGDEPNNEVKVLLIGNGSVGKTQIAGRLAYQETFKFDTQHQSTHAISLLQRHLPCSFLPQGSLLLNLWDFGGQDIYHATHRLFMRTRALFLLAWDKANEAATHHTWQGRDYNNEPLRYWLSYAQYFGENSPIIVLQNKIDATAPLPDPYPEPAQNELKKLYPVISDFVGVSAKTAKGFGVLEHIITKVFAQNADLKADLLNKKLPKTWLKVRDQIREEQAKLNGLTDIDFATFAQWCSHAEIPQSAHLLARFLHHTGVIYYQGDYFGGRIIINQAWAIEAVYKILDREDKYYKILEHYKGELNYENICDIWQTHSDRERELFIDFMLSSELCFETTPNEKIHTFNNRTYTSFKDRTFVVPQLLPEQEPDFLQAYAQGMGVAKTDHIAYDFLPSVFIQRFIIKAHRFSTEPYRWQHGIGLKHDEGFAVVRAQYKPEYSISIAYNAAAAQNGLHKAIREELQALQNEDKNIPRPEHKKEGFDALSLYRTPPTKNNITTTMQKLNVFISYSHKDEAFKEALDTHLTMLKRSNKIATWNDRAILAGTEWDNEIKQELADAHIIILLVSAAFLASDYIWQEELTHAMQRHQQGTARIIPIFIRACDWKGAPFGKLQGLPRDAKPVGTADNDDVWTAVAIGISAVVDDALQKGIGVAATTDKPTATTHNQNTTNGNNNIIIQGANNSTINVGGGNANTNPTPPKDPPQTILFLAANPTDTSRLQTDKEYNTIKAELERGSHRDRYQFLLPQSAVTITELIRAMNDKPNIVHFSGHGTAEGIVIATDDNNSQTLPSETLKRLFRNATNTQLVLLNACYSAEQAKIISQFGMYVIGNNLPIGDNAAISFAQGLYNGLGEGKTIESAYNDAMMVLLTKNPDYAHVVCVWKDGNQLAW